MLDPQKSISERFALLLAEWFYAGRSPRAPGTVGSLATLPFAYALRSAGTVAFAMAAVAVSLVGLWASNVAARVLGEKDPQNVVIDEVAGVLLALSFVSERGVVPWALAFVLFRLFDITKPGPIDRVQHLPPPGLGIMADDVLAGLLAGALTLVATRLFPALG